jgi:lysophospholipase L1-like esterase
MVLRLTFLTAVILFSVSMTAQVIDPIPILPVNLPSSTPPLQDVFNVVSNASALDGFFEKLVALKRRNVEQVSVVHIGDSHLQAGSLSSCVRKPLQQYFGNRGRGLVFPYRMAKSNSPHDIVCSSNNSWTYNRLTRYDTAHRPGISGFVVKTNIPSPEIGFHFSDSQNSANKPVSLIKLYVEPVDSLQWGIQTGSRLHRANFMDSSGITFLLDTPVFDFKVIGGPDTNGKSIFGFSLERSDTGLLYHSIGVNGAQYKHYNETPLFWKQLTGLQADLYILSLGTNEAQNTQFDESEFSGRIDGMVNNLRKISPQAGIILSTAQDSYLSGKSNEILRRVNEGIRQYSIRHRLPLWDLYKVTNGYKSCYYWNAKGYMSKDRVHFTNDMYCIQGTLLNNAISNAFNAYLRSRQN